MIIGWKPAEGSHTRDIGSEAGFTFRQGKCLERRTIFPYGGFGSLLVAGELSREGRTFFARRIIAFSPELRHRRLHVPLRKCDSTTTGHCAGTCVASWSYGLIQLPSIRFGTVRGNQ